MPVERRPRLRTTDLTAVAIGGGRPRAVESQSDATISSGAPRPRRTEDCSASLHPPRDEVRGSGPVVGGSLIIQPG